jgi:hypothetical protein
MARCNFKADLTSRWRARRIHFFRLSEVAALQESRIEGKLVLLTGILGSNAFAHLSNLKVESMGRKYFW